MEKKTGNLGCFVCPLPVFFSFNYQLFLATLPKKIVREITRNLHESLSRNFRVN